MGKSLAAALLIALAWIVASGQAERWVLYPFDPTRSAPPAGLREVTLPVEGAELVLWVATPAPGKPTILYFHGNAGNLAARTGRFAAFTARGFGLVALAYRGSSGSTGHASEATLVADAGAVSEALPGLTGTGSVVYYGESLGSAVALALADRRAPDGIVLEAPFASLTAMSEALYGSPALARLAQSQWDSLGQIATLRAPLLILHGSEDRLVPPAQGRALFDAATSADKRFMEVPGAGHEDVWQPQAQRTLYQFLERL